LAFRWVTRDAHQRYDLAIGWSERRDKRLTPSKLIFAENSRTAVPTHPSPAHPGGVPCVTTGPICLSRRIANDGGCSEINLAHRTSSLLVLQSFPDFPIEGLAFPKACHQQSCRMIKAFAVDGARNFHTCLLIRRSDTYSFSNCGFFTTGMGAVTLVRAGSEALMIFSRTQCGSNMRNLAALPACHRMHATGTRLGT
jgi:hypothetical protein